MAKTDLLEIIRRNVLEQWNELAATLPEVAEEMTYEEFCLEVMIELPEGI